MKESRENLETQEGRFSGTGADNTQEMVENNY
jgi:hypothetical protein